MSGDLKTRLVSGRRKTFGELYWVDQKFIQQQGALIKVGYSYRSMVDQLHIKESAEGSIPSNDKSKDVPGVVLKRLNPLAER